MSARKPQLLLTRNAQRDLQNILVHTERQWGRSQRRVYRRRLNEAFAQLMNFPDLGHARPDLGLGLRIFRVGQHMVVYRPSDTEMEIVRILHVRRDLDATFGE